MNEIYYAHRNKTRVRLITIIFLLIIAASKSNATVYYNKSTGQLNTPSSWGTNTDGTGTAPGSFTNAGDIFNLNNTPATQTFTTTWVLGATSGSGLGGVVLNVNTNLMMAASNNGIVINGTASFPGSLVIANGDSLEMNTGSANTITLSTSNATIADNGAIETGCTSATPIPAIFYAGAVEYNGTSLQKPTAATGTTYTILIINNNCSVTSHVTFASGASLELESGELTAVSSDIIMNGGSHLLIDQGTLSEAPTSANFNPTDITYTNLGENFSGTINTGTREWPTAYTGNVIINYPGVTFTLPAPAKTPYNLTVTAGTLDAANTTITLSGGNFFNSGATVFTTASLTTNNFTNTGTVSFTSGNLNVSGSWANNGTFTSGTGTVTFNSSTTQTIAGNLSGTSAFYDLTFNGSGSWSFTSHPDVDVTDNFTITAGTVISTSDTLTINNNYTNSGTFTNNGGTVLFTSTTITNTIAGTLTGTSAFYNLVFNGTGTWSFPSATNVTVANNFTLIAGTVDPTTDTLTIDGNFANNSTLKETTGTLVAEGDFVNTGTFKESTGIVNLAGNFTNSGTFTEGTGTVDFDGTGLQTITGSITFYNMTIDNSLGLYAANSAAITVDGTMLFITGNYVIGAGNTLTISGSTSGMTSTTSFTGGTTSNLTIAATSSSFTIFMDQTTVGTTNAVGTLTLSHPGGTVTLGASSPMYIATNVTFSNAGVFADGGNNIYVEGSWINDHNTGFSSTGTVIFDGTGPQTLGGSGGTTFNNLINNNVTGPLSVTHNTFIAGTLNVNTATTLNPSPAVIFNNGSPQGTITGSGTIEVTIPGAFVSQYRFGTYDLDSLTANYNSNAAQTVNNPSAYGTLLTSNGGIKTVLGNITVNNVLNVGSGSILDMTTYMLNSGGSPTYTVNGILRTGVADTTSTNPLPSGVTWNGNGTIEYEDSVGGQTVVAGIYNNLQLDDTTNSDTTGGAITINGMLTLGNLTIGANNLTLTATASISGASAINYIIADSSGQVIQQMNANGTFTFPIGDAINYTPIVLNANGSSYSSANIGVNVTGSKPTQNANTTNYINRYWSVTPSGISGLSYTATANFADTDVVGVASDIAMGAYNSALPWIKYGVESSDVLTSGTVSDTGTTIFTGLNNVAGPIAISAANTTICIGGNAELTGSGSSGDAVLAYTWTPNSALTATTGISVTASPTTTTTYTLTVTDGNGFTNTTTTTISVNALPSIISYTLLPSSQIICDGSIINLGVATTGGAGTATYTWNGPGITTDNITSVPTINYATNATGSGLYDVVLSYSGSGCTATAPFSTTLTYSVNVLPSIFTASVNPIAVCADNAITLTATSTGGAGVTYLWTGGTSTIVNNTSINGTAGITNTQPDDAAAYTVIASAPGCGSSMAVTNVLIVYPTVNAGTITGASSVNVGSNITLTDAVSGGSWSASNTNAIVSGGVVTGESAGTVTISYAVTGSCGTAYATKVITVNNVSISGINGNTGICQGTSTQLTDSTTGGTWSMVSPYATVVGSTGVVTASSSGAHGITTVTYTVGSAVATIVITVNPNPSAVQGPGTACSGTTVMLTDLTAGGSWSSSGAASISGIGTSTTFVGTTAGVVNITYMITATGCISQAFTTTIIATPAPIAGVFNVCTSVTTELSDANTGGGWTSSNTAIASVSGAYITGQSAGTATITYVLSGCFITQAVTVNTHPGVITGNTGSVCPGSSFTLADGTGAWSSGNTAIATVDSGGMVTGVSGGTSVITYALTGITGCTATTTVTINAAPAIAGATSMCANASTTLSDASGGGTWSSGNTLVATIGSSTGIMSGVGAGVVNIVYTTAAHCTVPTTLTVNAAPTSIGGPTNKVCAGNTITLSDNAGGGAWSSSNTTVGTVDGSGDVTGQAGGTTMITYTLAGCSVSAAVTVNNLPGAINGASGVCSGATTTLTDATAGGAWSITGGTATIGSTGIVTGTASGTATVSYTIASTGCSVGDVLTVSATAGPITGGGSTICAGSMISLSDAGSGTWSSSSTAVAQIGSATGMLTGEATGTATISYLSGGCYAKTVVTVSGAVGVIKGSTSVCQGLTLSLSDATTGGTWSSGNTLVATIGTGGIVTGLITGATSAATANISYSSAAGCIASVTITVNPIPLAIHGASLVCQGKSITLTDGSASGVWSMSSSYATIVGSTGVVTASSSGANGLATVSYTLGGCNVTDIITVNPNPSAVQGVGTACAGVTVSLTDLTAGGTWSSSGAASISGAGTTTTFVGSAAGAVSITYMITATGCISQAFTTTIIANPGAISGVFNMCTGVTTLLSDPNAGGIWTSTNTTVATVSGAYVTGHAAGTTTMSYVLSGCSVTQVVTVNMTPVVSAIGAPASISFSGGAVTISDATAGGVWTSSNPATIELLGSTGTSVSAEALTTSGSSVISYAVTNAVCVTTVTKTIGAATAVRPGGTTGIAETAAPVSVSLIPNPNKGMFTIKGTLGTEADESVTLEVINLLGQVVYKNDVVAQGGSLNEVISLSNNLANGMYVLSLHTETGNIVLHFVITQ